MRNHPPLILLPSVAALVLVASSPSLFAVNLPTAPGLSYRIAFVTSAGTTATSSNIADYNSFVTTHAPTLPADLGSVTWTAIGSTTSVDAIDNTLTRPTDPSAPIYNTQGDLVAADNLSLWTLDHSQGIYFDETGSLVYGAVWTGTVADGRSALGYELGSSSLSVVYGWTLYIDSKWINFGGTLPATGAHSLYGISSIITNPVPEPGTAGLLYVAGLIVLCRRRIGLPSGSQSASCTSK
jgi:hypothetical protein